MKLISLNIWGGHVFEALVEFLNTNKNETDIFCFQEVYESDRDVLTPKKSHSNILNELKSILSDFDYIYSPSYYGRDFEFPVDYPLSHGPAIFWKKNLSPKEKGDIFAHRSLIDVGIFPTGEPNVPKNFQYLIFDKFIVINVHGYWAPSAKFDTPERIKQSEIIIDFAKKTK